jgi:hypothetical protein
MSDVIERGAEVAREIVERYTTDRPREVGPAIIQTMLAEAYAIGSLEGVIRAQKAVALAHARIKGEIT